MRQKKPAKTRKRPKISDTMSQRPQRISTITSANVSASKQDVDGIMQIAAEMGIACERGAERCNSKDLSDLAELAIIKSAEITLVIRLFRAFLNRRKRSVEWFQPGVGWGRIDNPTDNDIEKVLTTTRDIYLKHSQN
jgi:hypothetical protein